MTVELDKLLTPDLYDRLQAEADRQHAPLGDVLREAVAAYLDEEADDHDIEDTPDDVILANFRQGWHEAMTGQTIPADEAMAMLRAKRAKNE